jgi:CheY-like chemotaxis protein
VEIALQDSGIEVAVVSDGTAALDVPEKNVKPFRVVITDINLGAELDRWEVARRACELNHALPIINQSISMFIFFLTRRIGHDSLRS